MILKDGVRAFRWVSSQSKKELLILDQLKIPQEESWIRCTNHRQVADCIRRMHVRGAPAIGCVAAYGISLAAYEKKFSSARLLESYLETVNKTLASTRPTAVNLFWALKRMADKVQSEKRHMTVAHQPCGELKVESEKSEREKIKKIQNILEREAIKIYKEDLAANYRIGNLGAKLFSRNSVVLTHCNTGSLATSGWGTALGVIRSAFQQGKIKKVLVDETRPYLQGARLTTWELKKDRIPHELITDNMAAHLMKTEKVDAVIVGSDRIARNGDVANKIGTYGLAVLCHYHKIPFYVAAPTSTVDLKIKSGIQIPIEERSTREVTHIKNFSLAPIGVIARHPAFDVTPHSLITAIITEKGIAKPPSEKTIKKFFTS